jgi:hypothetical protein
MMEVIRLLAPLLLVLPVPTLLAAEPEARARIALFEPVCPEADSTLTAVLAAVADTVELILACLDRYKIKRLPPADPAGELQKIRAYCAENRIDQAIGGSASARKGGGYAFRLVVYDRRADSITVVREGASTGELDLFDVTDALVASLLEGLSGTHMFFGSLAVKTDPPGANVSVNGRDVGAAPVALRGLPVGSLRISARAAGREDAETTVAITDGAAASASLSLARSTGKCSIAVPDDAAVAIRSKEIGEKVIQGSGAEVELPTGLYEVQANCPGLAPMSEQITIRRGETSRWMPWPKGYLAVESNPPEARIFIDDEDRGVSPPVVEVEPGSLHKVELPKVKYQAYRADVNVDSGSKTSFAAVLTPLPGSIRVETNLSGANARVEGIWKSTPCTFEGLAPGPHEVTIRPLLVRRRYFACEGNITVSVKPAEVTTLSKTLIPGTAYMQLFDAPPDSIITVDGAKMDTALARTAGVEVPPRARWTSR